MKGIALVSDGRRIVRQLFQHFVELRFGFVRFALHGIDIDEVGNSSVVTRALLGKRFQFTLGFVVLLQMEQTFYKLLEMTNLVGLLIEFFIQLTGFFIILLAVKLRGQLLIDLDLILLLGIHFLAFGGHVDLGIHRYDENEGKEQEENPVSFHGKAIHFLFIKLSKSLRQLPKRSLK